MKFKAHIHMLQMEPRLNDLDAMVTIITYFVHKSVYSLNYFSETKLLQFSKD